MMSGDGVRAAALGCKALEMLNNNRTTLRDHIHDRYTPAGSYQVTGDGGARANAVGPAVDAERLHEHVLLFLASR